MIDYETYCRIKQYQHGGLTIGQVSKELSLNYKTVENWFNKKRFQQRKTAKKSSKLDPFKADINRQLEKHDFTAKQIFQSISEAGFKGSYSLVKQYVHKVRPRRLPGFLTLAFAPGECAQVDWGLCRARHRPHYAVYRTMPSNSLLTKREAVFGVF